MYGLPYLVAALILRGVPLGYSLQLYVAYSDMVVRKTFRCSIACLAFVLAALLFDHDLHAAVETFL
jgi:heme O synthase-like polyprenyltransferase